MEWGGLSTTTILRAAAVFGEEGKQLEVGLLGGSRDTGECTKYGNWTSYRRGAGYDGSGSMTDKFVAPTVYDNPDGWGPALDVPPEKFRDMPYAPFSKSDRLGRAADWFSHGRYGGR